MGLFAIHRLSQVVEKGVVDRSIVFDRLAESIVTPLKSLNLVPGLQRVAVNPVSKLLNMLEKVF
ncbi:MAG: hypothetical protein ACOCUL_01965 [Bacteroidota bacterium]